jgi:hypothetical protein
MSNKYVVVSGALFGVVAVMHILRALNQWPVQIAGIEMPMWASWIGAVVAAGLCAWAFQSRGK